MPLSNIALIVIDIQQGMQSNTLPPRNNLEAENNIGKLQSAWRAAGLPVVNVRHISRSPESVFQPGQAGALFQERLAPLPQEHVVEKNIPCAFTHTGLERWLHSRDIRDVVIVGVSTNNSVESTARSAGNLGFSAVVVADATFAFEQRDYAGVLRTAQEVHDMSLSNINGEYAAVRTTAAVLADTLPLC